MRSSSIVALLISTINCSGTFAADQNIRTVSLTRDKNLPGYRALEGRELGIIPEEPTETKGRDLKRKKRRKKKNKKTSPKGFMIKLYWEKGYEWQYNKYEVKWCMEKDGNTIEIQGCSSKKSDQRWKVDGKSIRTASGNECITKTGGKTIELERCDGSKSQQWEGFRKGGGKFELHPAGSGRKVCVTQHHHPSRGEELKVQVCGTARRHDTSYWNVY